MGIPSRPEYRRSCCGHEPVSLRPWRVGDSCRPFGAVTRQPGPQAKLRQVAGETGAKIRKTSIRGCIPSHACVVSRRKKSTGPGGRSPHEAARLPRYGGGRLGSAPFQKLVEEPGQNQEPDQEITSPSTIVRFGTADVRARRDPHRPVGSPTSPSSPHRRRLPGRSSLTTTFARVVAD